jgi:AcrR family transcriptional regulator
MPKSPVLPTHPARDRTGRAGYRPDDIVDIAVAVFLERGYDGTSMSDLAQAAGVTKSSFYHHVAGKEELFARGTERALDALFAVLDEPDALTGPALGRLRHIIGRTVAIVARHRPEVALLVRTRGNTEVEKEALARRREFDRAVTRVVRQAIREGELATPLEASLFARLALGAAVSVVEWYRPEGGLAPPELIAAVERFIFESPLAGGMPANDLGADGDPDSAGMTTRGGD